MVFVDFLTLCSSLTPFTSPSTPSHLFCACCCGIVLLLLLLLLVLRLGVCAPNLL